MTTENKSDQQKQPRRPLTEMEYHEMAQWKKGENIIKVMGGLPGEPKTPIAFIKLESYDEGQKPILVAQDLEGNDLFERTSNLYELKKQIRENEQRLTKEMIIKQAKESKDQPGLESSAAAGPVEEGQTKPLDEKAGDLNSTRKSRSNGKHQPKSPSR